MKKLFLILTCTIGLFSCAPSLKLTSDDDLPTNTTTGNVEIVKEISTTLDKTGLYDLTHRYIVGVFSHPKSVVMYENKETGKIYIHWSTYTRIGKNDGYVKYAVFFDLSDQKAKLSVSNICYEGSRSYLCKAAEKYLIDGAIEKPRKSGNIKEYNARVLLRKKIAKDIKDFTVNYELLIKSK